LRVVLDTNILISALVFPGGPPEAVYRSALEGRIELVTSPPLLAELGRVLVEKFGWEEGFVSAAVAQAARTAAIVRPERRLNVVRDDPADDRVLEAPSAGGAEAIVSGDRHLLRLRAWEGIRIQRATVFLTDLDRP